MTGRLIPPAPTMACPVCGGRRVRSSAHTDRVCDFCWSRFQGWLSNNRWPDRPVAAGATDEIAFNHWLAHKLTLSVQRLGKFGVACRCEAIVGGSQCGGLATMERDKRPVCWQHGVKASSVTFIDDDGASIYFVLGEAIKALAGVDEQFKKNLLQVAAFLQVAA